MRREREDNDVYDREYVEADEAMEEQYRHHEDGGHGEPYNPLRYKNHNM